MNTESEQGSTESTSNESLPPKAAEKPAAPSGPRRDLRIGSQRGGLSPDEARPKPPPVAPPAIQSPLLGTVPEGEGDPSTPAAHTPTMGAPALNAQARSQAAHGGDTERERPARPRRESLESDAPAPLSSAGRKVLEEVAPAPPVGSIRPPRMSPELEAEVEAALGGMSLDRLMANEAGPPELELETKYRAVVSRIGDEFVFFQIGPQHQGVAGMKQFPDKLPDIGTPMDVVVSKFIAEEGLYEVVIPGGAVNVADWSDLVEGAVIEVLCTGHNKGGLEVEVRKIRGFIPAGQISTYRVEDFSEFVGQKLTCVVVEANAERRNLVLSRRAVMEREKAAAKEKFLQELAPGQIFEGTVTRIHDFGAFVDLGGVDGLVHVSKLGWDRIKHPKDVLSEGQTIKVRVEKIDPQTGKISLSYRDTTKNPWDDVPIKYAPGTTVRGVVSRIADYGAFVKLEPGVEGLVHISELAHHRVSKVTNNVKEGQEVEAKVLTVDRDKQKLSLSIKALLAAPAPKNVKAEPEEPEDAPPRELAVKRTSNAPLKGGIKGKSGGEKFGLNW